MAIKKHYMNGKEGDIVGIRLFSKQKKELLAQVQKNVEEKKPFVIHTIYSEILLTALRNNDYREILKKADANVIDGIGVEIARRYQVYQANSKSILRNLWNFILQTISTLNDLRNNSFSPIKGRLLFYDLLEFANRNRISAILIGNDKGSAQLASKYLRVQFPDLQIYPLNGPYVNTVGSPVGNPDIALEKEVASSIREIKDYVFVFVAMGAPKQEFWISRIKAQKKNALWIGVGGTFDYVSGAMKRPPAIFERNGIEWLWRLIQEPKRLGRIINAIIVLPIMLARMRR